MSAYHSFLICDHPKEGFVNVYIDGLIIGQIIKAENKFVPDPLMERRNPFGSLEALRAHMANILDVVAGDPKRFQSPTPAPPSEPAYCDVVDPPWSKAGREACGLTAAAVPKEEQTKKQVEGYLGEAVEVIVNTGPEVLYFKEGEPREITYEQIIRFACDQMDEAKGRQVKPPGYDGFPMMSVTYMHKVPFEQLPGERGGSLCKGKKVAVTPGMIINAYCT